jgi:hypothetical protein
MRRIFYAVALACAGAVCGQTQAAEIGGRYAVQSPSEAPANSAANSDSANRMVEIAAHRNAYSVTYEAGAAGRRKRHGWGLLDGDQLVVALSTGGSAYGVAIYHHVAGEHSWSGPWISSIDAGASLGRIRFEEGGALAGRHALVCSRPGAGSVSGTVEIKPAADGYQLTFSLGRVVLYRGVGLLLPGDRLAVGWSFGSSPEVAAYQVGDGGALSEHRLSWTHPDNAGSGQLMPISDDQYAAARARGTPGSGMPLFAAPADATAAGELPVGEEATGPETTALTVGPASPQVKAWSYGALMRQYGKDGWAERWLRRQLTPEEMALLRSALGRHTARGQTDQEVESRSIGTLIEDERAKEAGDKTD